MQFTRDFKEATVSLFSGRVLLSEWYSAVGKTGEEGEGVGDRVDVG